MRNSTNAARHRFLYLFMATITIGAGLVLRRVHLGLPVAAVKYGGSALWAMMVYWIVAALRPAWQPAERGVVAALAAALVEFFKLYHAPSLDGFRSTLAGTLLLGRHFSLSHLAVYCLTITLAAAIDGRAIRRG